MVGLLLFGLGLAAGLAAGYALWGAAARRLRSQSSAQGAALARAEAERDRLAAEAKLLELSTESRNASIKAESAELRRRMDELADRLMGENRDPTG